MSNIRIAGLTIFLILSHNLCAFSESADFARSIGLFEKTSGPQLLYPAGDKVDLTGRDFLEFRWVYDIGHADRYIFKIYKGYNMYAKDLIFYEDLASSSASVKVRSSLFEADQAYTWSLVRVHIGGQKSDKSFSSFRVIGN